MRKKVLDINLDGFHLECIKLKDKTPPFRVYRLTYGHRVQVAKCNGFMEVLDFIRDVYLEGVDTMSFWKFIEWAKRNAYN